MIRSILRTTLGMGNGCRCAKLVAKEEREAEQEKSIITSLTVPRTGKQETLHFFQRYPAWWAEIGT
jgi:hypothetical protein